MRIQAPHVFAQKLILSQMALQRCHVNFSARFLGWILGGEFLDGEFFRGPLFLERKGPKNSTQEFGSEIRASKIRLAEFGPKFGFRRCKIPCAEICPWLIPQEFFPACIGFVPGGMAGSFGQCHGHSLTFREQSLMSAKFFARDSRAENGCANSMGAWAFLGSFCWKPSMSLKFLVLRGGGGAYFGFLGGGVEVPILFLWAQGFFWNFAEGRWNRRFNCRESRDFRALKLRVLCGSEHLNRL